MWKTVFLQSFFFFFYFYLVTPPSLAGRGSSFILKLASETIQLKDYVGTHNNINFFIYVRIYTSCFSPTIFVRTTHFNIFLGRRFKAWLT